MDEVWLFTLMDKEDLIVIQHKAQMASMDATVLGGITIMTISMFSLTCRTKLSICTTGNSRLAYCAQNTGSETYNNNVHTLYGVHKGRHN